MVGPRRHEDRSKRLTRINQQAVCYPDETDRSIGDDDREGQMILFKDPSKQREFAGLKPRLRRIIYVVEAMAKWGFLDDIVITDMLRSDRSSVHFYGRGVDIAILSTGGIDGTERIRRAVNELFPYGKPGVNTVSPLRHGTAPHIHIQCRE
jgi:hypothetical protein